MSISSVITGLQNAKDAIISSIGAKGVTVPAGSHVEDLAALITQIAGVGTPDIWGHAVETGEITIPSNSNTSKSFTFSDNVPLIGSYPALILVWPTYTTHSTLSSRVEQYFRMQITSTEACYGLVLGISAPTLMISGPPWDRFSISGRTVTLNLPSTSYYFVAAYSPYKWLVW
jgi:hypothetical protein